VLAVPVIKYYKQMGFKLDEMQKFIEGNICDAYKAIQRSFRSKIEELEREREDIRRKHESIKDWYSLITEAEMVIENNSREVSVKYVEASDFLYQEQLSYNDMEALIINIEFTNYVESLDNEITGPVILNFSSFNDRMENKKQRIRILQKTLIPCHKDKEMKFGGQMMAACYHIGPHETINETYQKICRWAKNHNYFLGEESFERYVTDYWTTRNSSQFVTEVMIGVSRQAAVASQPCEIG
jgi:effector-binding domain-containing protein